MKPGSRGFYRLSKPLVFILCLAPFLYMLGGAFQLAGIRLGANPVEALLDLAGIWALRFLLLGLLITPLQQLTGASWLIAFRRMIGLFAFFYVTLHLVTYVVLDRGLEGALIVEDVIKRPFITIGFLAFLLLLPLALTSTKGWMRRLGRRWKKLHKLVYLTAILGVWHYYWQVKLDTLEPTVYAIILFALLGYRFVTWRQKLRRQKLRESQRRQADQLKQQPGGSETAARA